MSAVLGVEHPVPWRLSESIAAYNAYPTDYAHRFSGTDMSRLHRTFMSQLPHAPGPVLDAGCGSGRDCSAFRTLGLRVVGVDLSRGLLEQARMLTDVPLIHADLRSLPFADERYRGVWACASLVHLDELGVLEALTEFRRVLVPGGILYASVKSGVDNQWSAADDLGTRHFSHFDPQTFGELIACAGFTVQQLRAEHGESSGRWLNVFASKIL